MSTYLSLQDALADEVYDRCSVCGWSSPYVFLSELNRLICEDCCTPEDLGDEPERVEQPAHYEGGANTRAPRSSLRPSFLAPRTHAPRQNVGASAAAGHPSIDPSDDVENGGAS